MITKLTPEEMLSVRISSFWFVPHKRRAAIRQLRRLEAKKRKVR